MGLSLIPGGAEEASCEILLNDQIFKIRDNLHQFLRRLRFTNLSLLLWVDAICIDQSDIEERTSQVALMRCIYANAQEVLVWLGQDTLGEDFKDGEAALELIPQFVVFLERLGETESDNEMADALADYEFSAKFLCVCNLLERPWWTRIWIVQEMAVARKGPHVCCGSVFVNGSWFERLAFASLQNIRMLNIIYGGERNVNLDAVRAFLRLISQITKHVFILAHIRKRYEEAQDLSLTFLLNVTAKLRSFGSSG